MHSKGVPRQALVAGLSALVMLASALLVGQAAPPPPPRCSDTNSRIGGDAAALRPAEVLLAITRPRAGEMVPEVMPAEAVTVSVDYWGPRLMAAAGAHKVDEYHLVFLLDVDNGKYVGTLAPTPRCAAGIVHTDSTGATFDHVMHGWHTVTVMLVGSNDVSVNPPVVASSTFVVTDGT